MNNFVKSHGLGNDYVVLDKADIDFELTTLAIKQICNRNFGIGSDGILLKVPTEKADFGLKIFNPDGSEAEKSGNGLRIFAKYLFDYGFTNNKSFTIDTLGGVANAEIIEQKHNKASLIKIDIGKAIFEAKQIPVDCASSECMDYLLEVKGKEYLINCVSVGNPHCVIVKNNLDIDEIMQYGQHIETHKMFPNRINLQFAKVISRNKVEVLIWERGAGYTLASGSSSSAVAAVLFRKKLIDHKVSIIMQGGVLELEITDDYELTLTGEVRETAYGTLSNELIEDIKNNKYTNL